jgi:tetratricopeptide (TPR) repeat protein
MRYATKILAVGTFLAVVLLVPPVANAAQAAGANSGRETVALRSANGVPPVPFERGLSPETLIKQRADQAAARVPGLRDAVAAAEALGQGRFSGSALLFTRAIEQAGQSSVENSGYFEGRGIAYALWNRYRLADDDFVQAIQLSPGAPTPKTWLAVVRRAEGEPDVPYVAAPPAGDPLAGQLSRWATEMLHGRRQDLQQARALALTVARDLGTRLTEGVDSDAILLEQAANLSRQGKHAESLAILQRIEPRFGNDPLWLYVKSGDDLALGRWADARAEYSRTLAARPDRAAAYLGRALAAAHLGRTRQVAVDRQMAGQLDPPLSRRFEDQHGREIAALLAAVPRQPADYLAGRLIDDARQKAPWPKLVQDGRLVVLAVDARRKWADEQDGEGRLRFEELAAADPGDAQRWADLATYVYRQTGVPTVWNGPDNPSRPLRIEGWQQFSDQCALAEQFADKALSIDPRNIRAIATKAWLLHAREDNAAAGTLADRGLRLAPFYPPLEQLKGLLAPQGSAAEWLRAPKVLAGRGWWTVENLTPAELAQARAYQQGSEQSMIQASRQAKAAYGKYAQALQASVLQGDYYDWLGDTVSWFSVKWKRRLAG